jgi:leucyl aminopeptidase
VTTETGRRTLTVGSVSIDNSASPGSIGGEFAAVAIPMHSSETGPVLAQGLSSSLVARFVAAHAHTEIGDPSGQGVLADQALFSRQGFTAETGQALSLVRATADGPTIVFVGCGPRGEVSTDDLRRASAEFVRRAGSSGVGVFVLPSALAEAAAGGSGDRSASQGRAVQVTAEGAVLGAYRFTELKSSDGGSSIEHLVIAGIGMEGEALDRGAHRGRRIAEAVCEARDLVNEPPSLMTPTRLAELTRERFSSSSRTKVDIWGPDLVESERLGGLLGVSRGSAEPARLVRVHYEPESVRLSEGRVPHVVIVGKGITFDSGGLSLKTAEGMVTMKTDMSGAAAVLETMSLCEDLDVPVRVTAIAPLTENMPGGRAIKPGDVLTARDGQTIEVLNTDAEGRLILADGLSLAAELEPDAIIDLATLTGAAVVALGSAFAGLFSNDESLAQQILVAAGRAGEPMWRLPLPSEYHSHIESDIADMKNIGKPSQAGSIVAALLLQRFVHDLPWAHIDMAGPARSDEDSGIFSKGGTGFGVRTLVELLDSFAV